MTAEFQEIVVPVDGSESSQRAAQFAARLSRATGTPMKLLYVFQAGSEQLLSMARLDKADVEQIKRRVADETFRLIHKALGEGGEKPIEEVLIGDPAEEIVLYLRNRPESLVVMGRRGLSRMEKLLIGSVSEKVVRHASGPVTLVH